MDQRLTGTVKWFNRFGGFGFIEPDGSDYSVYVDNIDAGMEAGERVEFSVVGTPRGPRAGHVQRLANITTPN
jgi:cold shock CspA family protein